MGRSPDGSGSRASHEAAKASSPEASIPNAIWGLRENADILKKYMDSFYEAKREQHDSMFGRPYSIEERVTDLLTLVQRLSVSVYQGLHAAASAIEAQRAETAQTGSVADESAVPEADAPTQSTQSEG